jgi:hypothetical protein
MSGFDPEWDYTYETRLPVDERIAALSERAREARAEAEHARHQPGLLGAARSAEAAAKEFEVEILSLREVAIRIDRGYPYWDRVGFDLALEACGGPWSWQPLSEPVTRDYVFPHDDTDLRLPLDVQRAYGAALETGLFGRYTVCSTFETDGYDEVLSTSSYLLGVRDFPRLGECLFFIAQWDS